MPEVREGLVAYTVRTLYNEENTVEREIIEHLRATKLGWAWRSREQRVSTGSTSATCYCYLCCAKNSRR